MNNKIIYLYHTFTDADIRSGNPSYARDLLSASLEIDTFEFEVLSSDTTLTQFVRGTPLTYYHDDVQMGIFYVQKISRTTVCTYRFECTSTIGLLDESYHNGGIYTGETVKAVVEDICGPYPVWIKTNIQNIQLYGWLPIATRRENLSQVLFAIGATLKVDYNGTLRVEGLWDGQSTEIDAGHMHAGGSVEYSTPVTQVIVTEHAYTANATETTELFSGTTAAGDKITFNEPCYDLTAEGFSILEAAANYAIVSAGSGTLTGKKYVHTTRQIVKDVQPAARELVSQSDNIVTVENATLVSLLNSTAVADRLVQYYEHTERISTGVVTNRESPGDVVKIYHPYDKQLVTGCIESSDVNISKKLKSTETILVGYTPPNIGEVKYYDNSVLISENTVFVVPNDVNEITVVLIGGGSGGKSGLKGEDGSSSFGQNGSKGGEGGNGGEGGPGGYIYQFTKEVTPGESYEIRIGSGGSGGIYTDGSEENTGTDGTETTFGEYSSSQGSPSTSGFTEMITGKIYGSKGENGISGGAGGDGGKYDENGKDGFSVFENDGGMGGTKKQETGGSVKSYYAQTGSTAGSKYDKNLFSQSINGWSDYRLDENNGFEVYGTHYYINGEYLEEGNYAPTTLYLLISNEKVEQMSVSYERKGYNTWTAHVTTTYYNAELQTKDTRYINYYGGGGGSGAVYKTNGKPGGYTEVENENYSYGGNGVNAVPSLPPTLYGTGGFGGNGGDGGGGAGGFYREAASDAPSYSYDPEPGLGGNGSDGTSGANGCVIIYYGVPQKISSGRFLARGDVPFYEKEKRMVVV